MYDEIVGNIGNNFHKKYDHTFLPHIDGTDGFYCALLVKKVEKLF